MAVDKIVTKLGGGAMKLLRLTPAGTRLAQKIEDAVDPNAIRQAVARGRQYLQGKPSQAAQARARREGESLRSAVGAKPKPKPVRVPVGSTSKPKPKTSRGGTSAARKPKGAPRSTLTSAARAAKRKPQKTSKPTTSRAGQMQNLANAQAQAAIGAAARRANPTAAVRPKVSAGGGGAGGKPPSKLAIGAGLGLVGAGIGAAALAPKKGAPRSTLTSAASQAAKKVSKPSQAAKKVSKPSKKPLKTSLRAARAAGDLYYKDPETGRKMAAVLKSDLKPGQSLTQYINDKEGKTPRAVRPRSKPTPPKSTRG